MGRESSARRGAVRRRPVFYIGINGMWRSLVAHFVRDEGAAGSNPVIPIGWLKEPLVGCVEVVNG